MSLYVEYLMYPYVNLFKSFFGSLTDLVCCFYFPGTDLYSNFTQSPFVFINEIHFLELKVCPKYLAETLKILTESFFAEVF